MGNKNEITRVNPLLQIPCLVNLKALRPKRLRLSRASFETIQKRILSSCESIGKSIPIYVNYFTNSLLYQGLIVIINHDIGPSEQVLYRGYKWRLQTQRKISMLSLQKLIAGVVIPVRLVPIYINKHDNYVRNNNTLFRMTNNLIGGNLCPSGMDGRN
jgi:hypothetical protein